MATPEPPPNPDVPRVLLFGHRGAGKSALIGALLQAGETQGETLRGEVVTSSVDLPRIRDAVYSGTKIEPTQQELASYTIRVRPWRVVTKPVGESFTVILDDCDGKAAESLLNHPEPITTRQPNSPLARAVVGADAIVLLVDASSNDAQLRVAFTEFDKFLDVVATAKTEAREVGGFPVYLVLTQCDRLAMPGDTMKTWEDRVNERSDAAWIAFDAFLKDADPNDGSAQFLSFGSVDLTVVAVAVRYPPLTGLPTRHTEPYRVAELFRDCFTDARAHRQRVHASDTRLKWTVRFAFAALAVLLMSLATVSFFPPQSTGPTLTEKVRAYALHEPPTAIRLAHDQLPRNKQMLRGFTTDSGYSELPSDLREFVENRLKEMEEYEAYREKLANAIAPGAVRNLPDLVGSSKSVRSALLNELAPPSQYGWEDTAAAELRMKWLTDCAAIEAAVEAMVERYDQHRSDGHGLMGTRTFDAGWLQNIQSLIATGDQPPFPLGEPIPNSVSLNHPRGAAVTYRDVYDFDEVFQARRGWEERRDQLLHLRDLADALGAVVAPNRPEPVLVLPEPNGVDSTALPGTRWTALLRTYTRQPDDYAKWEAWQFFDPARADLAARLKRSFDTGTRHVHKLLKVQDTKDGWKAVAASLAEPTYRDWGRLLHLLARLQRARPQDPVPSDPVAELATFLHDLDNKLFELDLRGFELSIPLNFTVGLDRVEPTGPLTVTITRGQETRGSVKFAVSKGDTRDNATVYTLTPEGNTKLAYFAGDDLRAELPVRAGKQDLKLIWDSGASNTFRFDRLTREPRLVKPTGTSEAAPGVKLTPNAATVIPKLPVLMPLPAK